MLILITKLSRISRSFSTINYIKPASMNLLISFVLSAIQLDVSVPKLCNVVAKQILMLCNHVTKVYAEITSISYS